MSIILSLYLFNALYIIDKILIAIVALIMIIYTIVKKVKKKKLGIPMIILLALLLVFELPFLPLDSYAVCSTVMANFGAVSYNHELKTRDHGLVKEGDTQAFTYHGEKYVNLTDELTNVFGDGKYNEYLQESDHYEVLAPLVIEENIKGFQWLSFTPDERTIYTLKHSPDQKILYTNYWGSVYCLEEEFENAKIIYNDRTNYDYYITYTVDEVEKEQQISLEVFNEIFYCEQKEAEHDSSYFHADFPKYEYVNLHAKSKDGRVMLEEICEDLIIYNGQLYYSYNSQRGRCLDVELP